MESQNKFCQSCGMPLKKDPQHGGTTSDGRKSELYCSYCFQDGTFMFTGTVEEMQEYCKGKMMEQGSPKWMAWMFTRGMKRLERWRNTPNL